MRWVQQLPLQKMVPWSWLWVWWMFALVVLFPQYSAFVQLQYALSGNAFSRVVSISPLEPSLSASALRRLFFKWVWVLLFAQFPFAVIPTLSTNRLFFPRSPSLVLEGLNCINRKLCVQQFPLTVEGQKVSLLCTQYAEHLPAFNFLQLYVLPGG